LSFPLSIRLSRNLHATFKLSQPAMDLSKGWVTYLRNASRQETTGRGPSCPLCKADLPQSDLASFKAHVKADAPGHPNLNNDSEIEDAHKLMAVASDKKP
jgi:hypothetical protein